MSSQRPADRRQPSERRLIGERRKPAEGRCAIIEVCRSMLHLALVAYNPNSDKPGDRVVTRSIRWRNEANSLHSEQGISELTEAFRTLVSRSGWPA